jgi:hypothetical protein
MPPELLTLRNSIDNIDATEKIDLLDIYAQIVVDCLKNTKLKNARAVLNKGNKGRRTSGINQQSDKRANKEMESVAHKKIPHHFNIIGNEHVDIVLKKAMFFKFKAVDVGELASQLERTKTNKVKQIH